MDYTKQISHTANALLDATDKVIELLNYFSQKGKVQDLPLSMYVLIFLCYYMKVSRLMSLETLLNPISTELGT